MSRTTVANVQGILAGHYDGRTDLTPFISTATVLVDWLDAQDTDNELSTTLLEVIERWLTAHFYAHADQIFQSKSTGGASGSFQGQTAMVFSSTQYGQTAMALDVTGKLAGRNKEVLDGSRKKATVSWLGLPPSEQLDVEDRD
jgi:hypothetical protein